MKSLVASTQEEIITVTWDTPDEYKESYRYNLTWQGSNGFIRHSNITETTKYDIDGLVPGSRYNFSVTTETSDGTQGSPTWNTSCTSMVITDRFIAYRLIAIRYFK